MKDTYVDGEKLARNGRNYYSASFPPQYRGTLLSTLVSFSVIQAGMAQQLNLKSCFVTGSIEILSFKPLIFIPDVLKTSQEEDVNTNQDQICWFRSILTLKDTGFLVC